MLPRLAHYSDLEYTTRAEVYKLLLRLGGRKNRQRLNAVINKITSNSKTYITMRSAVTACVITAYSKAGEVEPTPPDELYQHYLPRLQRIEWHCYSEATATDRGDRSIAEIAATLPRVEGRSLIRLFNDCLLLGGAVNCAGNNDRLLTAIEQQQWQDIAAQQAQGVTASAAMAYALKALNSDDELISRLQLKTALAFFDFSLLPDRAELKAKYDRAMRRHHPDVGTSPDHDLCCQANLFYGILRSCLTV